MTPLKPIARVIAFYLPQFHPIPENNKWWGEGFTEWTNTKKASPLFPGHYQPHVPTELGFYDLRDDKIMLKQAKLAKQHGIEAFCYYHYWFAGKRLLEKPFNDVLVSDKHTFPFCLCWANQSWKGFWHGSPERVLIEQTYPGIKDHEKHFNELLRAFSDDRYLKVGGKSVFIIFRPHEIPNLKKTIEHWRVLAEKSGLPGLYLIGFSFGPWNPLEYGFDASLPYRFVPVTGKVSWRLPILKLYNSLKGGDFPTVYSYKESRRYFIHKQNEKFETFQYTIPNWDNTPRSGKIGIVLHGSTPELFRGLLKKQIEMIRYKPEELKIIFLKSWNEWAEGNYVEPELKFGRGYLKVLKEELLPSDR